MFKSNCSASWENANLSASNGQLIGFEFSVDQVDLSLQSSSTSKRKAIPEEEEEEDSNVLILDRKRPDGLRGE